MKSENLYVVNLANSTEVAINSIGGKSQNLGKLMANGILVPSGYVITSEAFQKFLNYNETTELIHQLSETFSNASISFDLALRIQEKIRTEPIPKDIEESIINVYEDIVSKDSHKLLAVRSSAVEEDSKKASFAGQLDTYLGINGKNAVIQKIRSCWSAAFSKNVLTYCSSRGMKTPPRGVAVILQELITADKAGITFSINPITGNSKQIVIESAWGLGEIVVSGKITPDTWIIEKKSNRIMKKKIMNQEYLFGISPVTNRFEKLEIDTDLKSTPSLKEDELLKVASLASTIEKIYDYPQDIEWAIYEDKLFTLQSRPITTL